MNKIAFIDMEGVLIPEIWKKFANHFNRPELLITTREVPDYKTLMEHRINILKEYNITLDQLIEIIKEVNPLKGAKEFLDYLQLNNKFEIRIVSDCFYEFLNPLFEKIELPCEKAYCHNLEVNKDGFIEKVNYSREKGKHEVIVKYQKKQITRLESIAIGDAFNDFTMLHLVDHGFLFQPSNEVKQNAPSYFHIVQSYQEINDYLRSL
ncbi:bifunctional phosphoserine phosphatase/homoserine phosphotransferase ThrH [Acinetobacter sp. ACIN00229]|uniref:bifunctional phosphoserine phosphatase/homoserine phosphotransferase ThrH n=1 Tax=Acinetobacter sp. ACIN00229 TaxID=2792607 RepID=UPI0018DF9289|nr:bifunctional phosphoserine phosphatase/homoserine phosphotransferase ThrH [Acinetobacter sp. ACIN00229]MBI0422493.1 bifunctional phosphoserine phosphatase/homoserine phosphotransferase ThrH [Acinetobacter sp. ACIN00229]